MSFDLPLVEEYIRALKLRGLKTATQYGVPDCVASVPVLSWLGYQNPNTLFEVDLQKLLERDILRKNTVTGFDIIFESDCSTDLEDEIRFFSAKKLVFQCWPEISSLMDLLVYRVSRVLPGLKFESVSDPKIMGQVYYTMHRKLDSDWAEILTHETAHQYLFVITSKPSFYSNIDWNQKVFSPIRNTERPLIGVLHGAVSQAAMIGLAQRYLNKLEKDPENEIQFIKILQKHATGFLDAFRTLEIHHILGREPTLQELLTQSHDYAKEFAKHWNSNEAR